MSNSPSEDAVLRAKYLDWCSGRIAGRLVQLSPADVYRLAFDEVPEPPDGRSDSAAPPPEPLERLFPDLRSGAVGRLVDRIVESLALPSYEAWREMYRNDPGTIERELMGLWKRDPTPA